ncbi:MAG: chemotaxis protein CheW [Desulfobacterales bacterium]|nr:chemotaxis protein CheW [Desulfobacterales bacterium]
MQELKTSGDKGGKYLTFLLGDEEYGIAILKIKEIIGMMPITYVPQTPEFVKGVINLRGKVIPVIDLRLKFGLESVGHTDRTCIIVVEIQGPAGARLKTDYILGMGKIEKGVKILLDIDKVLNMDELNLLQEAA